MATSTSSIGSTSKRMRATRNIPWSIVTATEATTRCSLRFNLKLVMPSHLFLILTLPHPPILPLFFFPRPGGSHGSRTGTPLSSKLTASAARPAAREQKRDDCPLQRGGHDGEGQVRRRGSDYVRYRAVLPQEGKPRKDEDPDSHGRQQGHDIW